VVETPDRRQVVRLTVPWHLTGPGLEFLLGHLLELSSMGARIAHAEPLQEGLVCEVDLPPALGWGRLTARVVWTRPHTPEQTLQGNTRFSYQSGLTFVELTPEQRAVLAVALEILGTGASDPPEREPSG
jgi:hypothetical protein